VILVTVFNAAYLPFSQLSDTTESPEKAKRVKKGKEPAKEKPKEKRKEKPKEKPKGKVCITTAMFFFVNFH